MSAHEFIVVGQRRWCIGCDLFQMDGPRGWKPRAPDECPATYRRPTHAPRPAPKEPA
mgnify:CR=1 FL=1